MKQRWRLFTPLIALVLAVTASTVRAQEEPLTQPDMASARWHRGYELFRALLEQAGLEPVESYDEVVDAPSESVVVLMGKLPKNAADFAISVAKSGGAAIIASDLDDQAVTTFASGPVSTSNPEARYLGHDDCVRITDFDSEHRLMKSVGSLVVNQGGYLIEPVRRVPLRYIARYPDDCRPRRSAGAPLLAEVTVTDGDLFLCTDQSLFSNGMLWHGDNSALAINMATSLASGNRKKLLFISNEQLLGSYSDSPFVPPTELPDIDPQDMPDVVVNEKLALANDIIRNTQDNGLLNAMLANRPRNIAPRKLRRTLLFVAAGIATFMLIWRIAGNNANPREAMPRREMKSAMELQNDRRISSSEFGYAASMLARKFCKEVTGSDESEVWIKQLSKGEFIADNEASRELPSIVEIAMNSQTIHMSKKKFEALGASLTRFRQRHSLGQLLKQGLGT